jgi:hypothetical protein
VDEGGGDGLLDDEALEQAQRRQTEPDDQPAFVPLAADVAPQLALFGAPAPAAGGAVAPAFAAAPVAPGAPAVDAEAGEPAAFERRARLRDKRHRLVADLRRRDGRSHAEINRWLNRSTGIRRVEDASLDQLEQSIELLLGALSGRRR